MPKDPTHLEKLVLLILAGIAILALGVIAILALRTGTLDPNAGTLLGAIVAALAAFGKDIVQAIRSYSTAAQMNRMADQLAMANPVGDPGGLNDTTRPAGTSGDPVHTTAEETPS
jgi:predicted acylesterase/phospholipase RssA